MRRRTEAVAQECCVREEALGVRPLGVRPTKPELQRAQFTGSRETVIETVSGYQIQLKEKQYKRIDHEHREKLIEQIVDFPAVGNAVEVRVVADRTGAEYVFLEIQEQVAVVQLASYIILGAPELVDR